MTLGAALLLVAVVGLVGLVWVMFALVALALVAGGEPPVACVRSGMPVIRARDPSAPTAFAASGCSATQSAVAGIICHLDAIEPSLSAPQGRLRLLHLVNLLPGHRQVVLPTSVARVRFRQPVEDDAPRRGRPGPAARRRS